jgi:pyruvate kinase
MLSGETANGAFPALAVSTMANIVANAEVANSYYSSCNFMVVRCVMLPLLHALHP